MPTIYIPSLMQSLTGDKQTVEVEGATLRQVVEALEQAYPGMKERLVENGQVKPSISVAIDGEVTTLGMLEKVGVNSEVHFLPAISGGNYRRRGVCELTAGGAITASCKNSLNRSPASRLSPLVAMV